MGSRGKLVAFALPVFLFFSSLSATAVPTAIAGRVVDQQNQAVAGVAITVTRAGAVVTTGTTARDGSYSVLVEPGAYSMRFTPTSKSLATLNAYDVIAPRTSPLVVQLTVPTSGRAVVSGTVSLSSGVALASDTTVYFDGKQGSIGSAKAFRILPTAGSMSSLTVKGADNANFAFQLYGPRTSFNQDAYLNVVVPVQTQRLRVLTAEGTPVAQALIEGGIGSWGTSAGTLAPIEGLGTFTGTWYNKVYTDAQGWATIPVVSMASPTLAGYRVTPPSGTSYLVEQFQKVTGNGDIALVLTQKVSTLSGSVKDQNSAGISDLTVFYGSVSAKTDASGNFSKPVAAGTSGNFTLYYSSGSERTNGFRFSVTPFGIASRTLDTSKSHQLTLPLDNVTVKVTDASGAPVANALVLVTDADGYAPRGRYTLISGLAPFQATFASNGLTDSKGQVTLKTLRLDTPISGVLQVTPPANTVYSPTSTRLTVGAATSVTVSLPRPTVAVSGVIKTSDGTPLLNSRISFSDNQGNGGSSAIASDGSYSMTVPAGTKGSWTLGCDTDIVRDLTTPLCVRFTGGLQTISTVTKQDFTIPTYKSVIKVVDPSGSGIAGVLVKVSAGHDMMSCRPMISVAPDKSAIQAIILASATTDSSGTALIPMVAISGCTAEVSLTPPASSRYQDRSVRLSMGTDAENVVVLMIPAPAISRASVSDAGSGKVITLTGENFFGVHTVTIDDVDVASYRVVNATTITIPVASTFSSGVVTIENGGGKASITL